MLLQDARRADYQKVVAYLKGSEAQTWLARQTLRRPISGEVAAQVGRPVPEGRRHRASSSRSRPTGSSPTA